MKESSLYILFGVIVLILIVADLGIFNRKSHVVSFKEALIFSLIYVIISLGFGIVVYYSLDKTKGLEFFTGYLIEKSLSVDNIFVFIVIFQYFAVPAKYYHRVLFWGILGAILMRGIFIFLGGALVEKFHWIIYIFGAFLLYTGIKFLFQKSTEETINLEKNLVLRFAKKWLPLHSKYEEGKFSIRINRKIFMTPLLLVVLVVEATDLVFAVDSIPAIFGITTDVFIVYTSNIFAILGLRAMFFLLASVIEKFHYLKSGLAVVLGFVGIKMLIEQWYNIGIVPSLLTVTITLALSIILSLIFPKEENEK